MSDDVSESFPQSGDSTKAVVRTSSKEWFKEIAKRYKERSDFTLLDDAHIGIDPSSDSLMRMGLKAKLAPREWTAVLVSLGVSALGAWLLVMAVLDPEPYSKVAAAIATGAALLGGGGLVAVRILTHIKPPNIRVGRNGIFEIEWT